MKQASDTKALRDAFVNSFMWMTDVDTDELSMPDIMDLYDQELGTAKQKYGSRFDSDAQWAEADRWLSDREYFDPATL